MLFRSSMPDVRDWCPIRVCLHAPVSTSHTRMLVSRDPLTTWTPSNYKTCEAENMSYANPFTVTHETFLLRKGTCKTNITVFWDKMRHILFIFHLTLLSVTWTTMEYPFNVPRFKVYPHLTFNFNDIKSIISTLYYH
jgi:hypothetical protein